ncbi:ATP-binding protein [Kitasatospora sp. NPDC057223]|uniref:sensor histidine kinase n=1 Tax=Kitasatospora sp. NPDC057223 TaxID=3346055 RepID=UPI003634B8B7
MGHSLRFSPGILARLGEELVPYPDLGILELVRNSYDADASRCAITLRDATVPGGSLVVEDDGDGMTAGEIAENFLLVGRSSKPGNPTTQRLRAKVGEKGLGRLASLRLGRVVHLVTRPREEPGREYRLSIDWQRYEQVSSVDEVDLEIRTADTDQPPGTTVTIDRLRTKFSKEDMARLSRNLLLLTGVFPDSPTGFQAHVDAPEFQAISTTLQSGYRFFDECEFKLVAHLDSNGKATARLYDWRGDLLIEEDHEEVALRRYGRGKKTSPLQFIAPEATFELWMYVLDKESFARRNSKFQVADIRPWLKEIGGVHLYHRGIRVTPYGDPGHDWLDLNLRRAASPEVRPSTNTSVGRVSIEDGPFALIPKTDRMGFQEDAHFQQLREFARRSSDWAAHHRLKIRDKQRSERSPKARAKRNKLEQEFQKALESLIPEDRRPLILQKWKEVSESNAALTKALEDDRLLYRTLGTLGTSTAVFAHEALAPAGHLIALLGSLDTRARQLVPADDFAQKIEPPLSDAVEIAEKMQSYTDLPLALLNKNKRQVRVVDLNQACRSLVKLFHQQLASRNILVDLDLWDDPLHLHTTVADLESLLANLLINSAHAMLRPEAPAQRTIRIATERLGNQFELTVADSGPGIINIKIDDIWIPGETTRPNGTGMGLTIVRDIVSDLLGQVTVTPHGRLGGAEFRVVAPLHTAEDEPQGSAE